MNCPKCQSKIFCKYGRAHNRQRYLCKKCSYHYTVSGERSGTGSLPIRRQALELHLEGLGFRSIGRILNFSNVTILKWIRAFGEQLPRIKAQQSVKIMEIDEMHSYIGSKKTIAGYELLLIEMKENSSTAYLVPGELQPDKSFGILSEK